MKTKVIRNYSHRNIGKEYIDIENSLFDRGTAEENLTPYGLELFMRLKAYENKFVNLADSYPDKSETEIKRNLKELEELGLINIIYQKIEDEKVQVVYLNNPNEIL